MSTNTSKSVAYSQYRERDLGQCALYWIWRIEPSRCRCSGFLKKELEPRVANAHQKGCRLLCSSDTGNRTLLIHDSNSLYTTSEWETKGGDVYLSLLFISGRIAHVGSRTQEQEVMTWSGTASSSLTAIIMHPFSFRFVATLTSASIQVLFHC